MGNVTHHCSTPVVVETPIVYDTMGQPMVRAKVGGVDTRLLLDTGASTHLLTLDLATRATLPVLSSNSGTDHAGANVPSWEVGEVSVQIQDRVLFLHGAVTFNGPPAFAKKRIGGALSPQHLHPSALVILDFVGDRLRLLEADDETVIPCLRAMWPHLRFLSLPRERGELVAIRAAITPFAPTAMFFNTGGPQTEVDTRAVPGLRGAPQEAPGRGVSGAIVVGDLVAHQTLRLDKATFPGFPVASLLVREAMSAPPGMLGMLGMDLLAGTVLAFRSNWERPVIWLVPR